MYGRYVVHLSYMHCSIAGQSGTGKSTLLIDKALTAIANGEGVCVIDPHGETVDRILARFPKAINKAIYLDFGNGSRPIAWNPLADTPEDDRPLIASTFLDTIKSVWDYSAFPTPDMDDTIYHAIATMLDDQDGTLLGVPLLFQSDLFRRESIGHIKDPMVRLYWQHYNSLPQKDQVATTKSTLNKFRLLLADYRLRNVLGNPKSKISLKDSIEHNKCLLIKVPQGQLGITKTRIISGLLLAQFHATVLRRESGAPTYHLMLDEVHTFDTPTLTEMLSGVRKFGVNITLTHQHLSQLSQRLKNAIIGNVSERIYFKMGYTDSEEIEKTIPWDNTEPLLHELLPSEYRQIPYSVRTFEPTDWPVDLAKAEKIVAQSPTHDRNHVEKKIQTFLERITK